MPSRHSHEVLSQLEGSYGFCAIFADNRMRSISPAKVPHDPRRPCIDNQDRPQHLTPQISPALLPHAQEVLALEDGHTAVIGADSCKIYDENQQEITPSF